MMETEIFKIGASWAKKLTKTRVQFLLTPSVVYIYWNKNIFRLVNIFNSISDDNIQRVVRTVKSETSLNLRCDESNAMLSGEDVLSRVKAVEQIIHFESTEQIDETLTNEKLQNAGEMFLYLIMCPTAIKPWVMFYKDLYLTQSPDHILLTLNRLGKGTRTAQTEHFARIAETLFTSMKIKMIPAANNTASRVGKSESEYLIINHPVHIMTKDHLISPSAFIPFCDFGGNMSAMGVKIHQFDQPVCKSFQAKIMNDRLCYEVDLNTYSDKNNIGKELELGFNFLMDYNEDRQVTLGQNITETKVGLAESVASSNQNEHAFVYLDTLGKRFL